MVMRIGIFFFISILDTRRVSSEAPVIVVGNIDGHYKKSIIGSIIRRLLSSDAATSETGIVGHVLLVTGSSLLFLAHH